MGSLTECLLLRSPFRMSVVSTALPTLLPMGSIPKTPLPTSLRKLGYKSMRDRSIQHDSDLEITGSQPVTSRVRRSLSVEHIGEALTPVRHTIWRPNRALSRASGVVSGAFPRMSLAPQLQLHLHPQVQTSWPRPLENPNVPAELGTCVG